MKVHAVDSTESAFCCALVSLGGKPLEIHTNSDGLTDGIFRIAENTFRTFKEFVEFLQKQGLEDVVNFQDIQQYYPAVELFDHLPMSENERFQEKILLAKNILLATRNSGPKNVQ